jgi:hypothetical protein
MMLSNDYLYKQVPTLPAPHPPYPNLSSSPHPHATYTQEKATKDQYQLASQKSAKGKIEQ